MGLCRATQLLWICVFLFTTIWINPHAHAAADAGSNMLVNPDFSPTDSYSFNLNGGRIAGRMLQGWQDNTAWFTPSVDIRYTPQSGAACGGGFRFCMQARINSGFMQLAQSLFLPAGRAYRLSVWARAQLPAGSSRKTVKLLLQLRQWRDPFTLYAQVHAEVDSSWAQLQLPFAEVPAASSASGQVESALMLYVDAPGTLWFASASLATLASGQPNLLTNPGFSPVDQYTFSLNGGTIEGKMAQGWSDNTDWAGPNIGIRYTPQSGTACGGGYQHCMQAGITSGFMQLVQPLFLPAGRAYSLSIWARAQLPAGSAQKAAKVSLQLRQWRDPFTVYAQVEAQVGPSWTQLQLPAAEVQKAAASEPGQQAECVFMVVANAPATLWLASASLAPRTAPATQPNLLANPGFSPVDQYTFSINGGSITGSMLQNWFDNTDWAGPNIRIRYTPQSGAACGGRYQQCLQASIASGFMQFGQALPLPAGRAYRLSVWLRATPLAGSKLAGAVATLSLRLHREPYTLYGQETAFVDATWRQLSVEYAMVPPAASGSQDTHFFQIHAGAPATVWMANASLTQLDPNAPLATTAVRLAPPATATIPRSYFCLHISGLFGNTWWWVEPEPFALAYSWPVLDFGFFRTWDSGVMWATIQDSKRGVFNWTMLDYMVENAARRKQKVLFTLGQTPAWASARPTEPATFGLGYGAPPKQISDWKAFVAALARRYKGRIHAYEMWNEPDSGGEWGFYNGTPEELAQLEAATADVLAKEDPSALLFTPGMSGSDTGGSMQWLTRYLAAGGGRRAQGVGWHAYVAAPEAAVNILATMRQVLAAYGLQRLPIWNTEGGVDVKGAGLNATSSAGWVARSFILHWALGLPVSCWYTYNALPQYEGLTALLPDGMDRDPAKLAEGGKAYRQVMVWMMGARMLSLSSRPDGIWVAELQRPTKPLRAWLVWSPNWAALLRVPAAWQVTNWQDVISGRTISIGSSRRVLVGDVPLLLA